VDFDIIAITPRERGVVYAGISGLVENIGNKSGRAE